MMERVSTFPIRVAAAIQTFASQERGASMVEYALLISLIAMAAFIAVQFAGTALDNKYDSISVSVANA